MWFPIQVHAHSTNPHSFQVSDFFFFFLFPSFLCYFFLTFFLFLSSSLPSSLPFFLFSLLSCPFLPPSLPSSPLPSFPPSSSPSPSSSLSPSLASLLPFFVIVRVCRCPWKPQKGVGSPRGRVVGGCEWPSMGAGKETLLQSHQPVSCFSLSCIWFPVSAKSLKNHYFTFVFCFKHSRLWKPWSCPSPLFIQ